MLFKYIKRFSKKVICLTISIYLLSSLFIMVRAENYEWTVINNDTVETNSSVEGENVEISSKDELNLECESAILIEQNSGQVLYEKNMHEQLRPASVTKLMSLLLIFEALDNGQIKLEDMVPCSQKAASMGGSQIWLDVREELSVHEMIKAMCVVSANDATYAMAEFIAGSEEAFVEKMNNKAKELGMNDTCFKNCHGIDEDGHLSSSYDISLMSRELLKNHPLITKYTTIWMDSLRDGKSELVNTNKLIRNYSGATGLKTGSTSLALYNLSASCTRDGLSLIAVIMKAPSTKVRFAEAQKLLDYGFNNYIYKELAKKGDSVKKIDVEKGVEQEVNAVYEDDMGILLKKENDKKISQNINVKKNIVAPIKKNQVVGEVSFCIDNKLIGAVNIISVKEIKRKNFVNITTYIIKKWFCMLRDC